MVVARGEAEKVKVEQLNNRLTKAESVLTLSLLVLIWRVRVLLIFEPSPLVRMLAADYSNEAVAVKLLAGI